MKKLSLKKRTFVYVLLAMTLLLAMPQLKALASEGTYASVEDAKGVIEEQSAVADDAAAVIEDAELYITEQTVPMYATFCALVPPLIAIVLALITKEVYTSLFIGILFGALFYANFNIEGMFSTLFVSGMIAKISDSWNIGILIFLVILGILVSLMNKVGGSAAYGKWAATKIKSKRGALLSTAGLGALIFVDDYFNCLTVGSVMRPVTDKFNISRAKLAYIIDATAAPVCILAPISSWAAAVSGVVEGYSGLSLFVKAIPYNYYALLTLLMIVVMAVLRFDFGAMKKNEENAENGDLYTTKDRPYAAAQAAEQKETKGKVIDLVLPVIILIVCCVLALLYTGGFFGGGLSIFEAFEGCDASIGLVYGSFITLVLTFFLYIPRKVITFKEFAKSFTEGFCAMVPAIMILIFAWTLGAMTGLLGADVFVASIVKSSAGALNLFLPAIVFLIALGLAFSTGTSWGTFGILLPIVVNVLTPGSELLIISVSACLAGAVCGDHVSPISDTTIMASTGAQCDHINHVSTQMPYALLVAAVSFVCYIIAALLQNAWISLAIAVLLMVAVLLVVKMRGEKKKAVK